MWRRVRWMGVALVACKPAEEVPSCEGSTTEQFATEVATHTFLEGCADIELGDYEVVGDGELELTLFTDSHQLLPRVTSYGDGAVFRGLRIHGEVVLEGTEPATLWRLPYAGGGEAGPAPLGAVELDAEGWPTFGEDDGTDDHRDRLPCAQSEQQPWPIRVGEPVGPCITHRCRLPMQSRPQLRQRNEPLAGGRVSVARSVTTLGSTEKQHRCRWSMIRPCSNSILRRSAPVGWLVRTRSTMGCCRTPRR